MRFPWHNEARPVMINENIPGNRNNYKGPKIGANTWYDSRHTVSVGYVLID
jgi:hypothetical protein